MAKRIVIICATSIATSTHIANRVREICRELGIEAVVCQEKAMDAYPRASRLADQYDFAIVTVEMPKSCNIPTIQGAPLISGIGEDQTIREIERMLKKG